MVGSSRIAGYRAAILRRLLHPILAVWALLVHRRTMRLLRARKLRVRRVLFVCYGNICRSPTAQRVAEQRLSGVQVESAGFHPSAGRSSPDNILHAASHMGIELTSWHSSTLSAERLRDADLVVLFDLRNLAALNRFPGRDFSKVIMLGHLASPPSLEIKDPYGFGNEAALRSGEQIDSAIQALAAVLSESPRSAKPSGS